jgi:nucleotide-binding universal stress UspA family protein
MYRNILVVVADHPSSQVAIEHGVGLAKALSSKVLFAHVLHQYVVAVTDMIPVVTDAPEEFSREAAALGGRLLDGALAVAQKAGVAAEKMVLDAPNETDGVVALAGQRSCDLIVVGTEGGNAVTRLLTGSTVPGLITRAGVPVMVCHPNDPCPDREGTAA